MDIKELHRLAKMANTTAKVSVRLSDEEVRVRWYATPNHAGSFSRIIPWTALGEDRGPDYLAVKEYLRMSAFYMEAFGGRPDLTSELFISAPAKPSPLLDLVPFKITREWAAQHRITGGYAEVYADARNEVIDEMIHNIKTGKPSPLLEARRSGLLPNNALKQPRPRIYRQQLHLKTEQLLSGDEVRIVGTPLSRTVERIAACEFGYLIRWKGGVEERFGVNHEHLVFRRGIHG